MATVNLLNLNVDLLFEQNSAPDIDVHKKIQELVEDKREELRTMVGERYRDLLKAADAIAEMQESASTLIQQVDNISANCRSLNDQQLIGFKTGGSTARSANKQLNNYFGTMVQVKLIISLPELIWSQIEQERFCAATELFIFSRHISTGLQLDSHNPVMKHLPVAKKQWEILKPFHATIKQSVIAALEREELNSDTVIDCLMSLLLLEKCNLNNVLKTFLQLRCAAFFNCLSNVEDVALERRRVKDRILASLKVVNGTIKLLGECFFDGLLFKKLGEHSHPNAPPTIALMDSSDCQFSYMLSDVISNFRPKFDLQTMDDAQMHSALEQWLADITRIAAVQLKNLFELVPTMKMIQEIKTESNDCRKNINFATLGDQFQLAQSLDIYELKYIPLINQRVHDIIEDSWAQAMQTTFNTLEKVLQQVQMHQKNIWTESSNDLPLSLEDALSEDIKIKTLLMRTKAYDSEIIALCAEFDRQLTLIVSETNVLLEEQSTKTEDKVALIQFLRDVAQTQLRSFIGKVKSLNIQQGQRCKLLFVVRLFVALVELCPNLKICFCQHSSWSWRECVGNVAATNVDSWNGICLLLEEEAFSIWLHIVDSILAENNCEKHMPHEITHDIMMADFANWEVVTFEQKDEQENPIHSTFRIPNQPRISLQSYLFTLIRSVNADVPETLPSKVLLALNEKCLTNVLSHYEVLADLTRTTPNQSVALQLYFDLKFLQTSFAVTRDDRALSEQFQKLQNTFRDNIDPFDFELFSEHIATNVKRAATRINCQLGVLTPQVVHGVGVNSTFSVAQEKDPNVLSLSGTNSIWFPLLPIITPTAGGATSAGGGKNTNTLVHEKEKPTTPTRKATTARKSDATKPKSFFGAVSQEWFR